MNTTNPNPNPIHTYDDPPAVADPAPVADLYATRHANEIARIDARHARLVAIAAALTLADPSPRDEAWRVVRTETDHGPQYARLTLTDGVRQISVDASTVKRDALTFYMVDPDGGTRRAINLPPRATATIGTAKDNGQIAREIVRRVLVPSVERHAMIRAAMADEDRFHALTVDTLARVASAWHAELGPAQRRGQSFYGEAGGAHFPMRVEGDRVTIDRFTVSADQAIAIARVLASTSTAAKGGA